MQTAFASLIQEKYRSEQFKKDLLKTGIINILQKSRINYAMLIYYDYYYIDGVTSASDNSADKNVLHNFDVKENKIVWLKERVLEGKSVLLPDAYGALVDTKAVSIGFFKKSKFNLCVLANQIEHLINLSLTTPTPSSIIICSFFIHYLRRGKTASNILYR